MAMTNATKGNKLSLMQHGGKKNSENIIVETEIQHPKLTVFQTCSIVISSIGGVSLFVATSTMMKTTGSVGVLLIIVLVSGLLNFSLAKCFTEVAIILPKAGGPYVFLLQVFGEFSAFLFLWGFIFMIITPAWTYLAYSSSLYIVQLFFPGCRPPDTAIKLLGACILVSVVMVNCMYLKFVTKIQAFLTSTKLIASAIIIVCGIISAVRGHVDNYVDIFEGSTTQPGDIAVSILSGMFLYGGWQLITFLLEEIESPEKNVPKTLTISFAIVISLSELIVASYFVLISPAEMMDADAVAVLFMERINPALGPVIAVFVTTTAIASLNAAILGQSRMVSAAARQHHLPAVLGTISDKYTMPWAATLFLCMISLLMLFFANLSYLIIMMSFYATVMGLSVLLCFFALRKRRPGANRPLKIWLGTAIVQSVISVTTLVMSIYQQPRDIGALVLFVLGGIPVYVVFLKWKTKPKIIDRTVDNMSILLQKVLLLKHI